MIEVMLGVTCAKSVQEEKVKFAFQIVSNEICEIAV